jgi:hypothetical protein
VRWRCRYYLFIPDINLPWGKVHGFGLVSIDTGGLFFGGGLLLQCLFVAVAVVKFVIEIESPSGFDFGSTCRFRRALRHVPLAGIVRGSFFVLTFGGLE